MIWVDIIVENTIPNWKLGKVFQELLNIPLERIQIIEGYDDFPDTNTMSLVCQKSLFHAGFVMMLSIYLFGEIAENNPNHDGFVSRFSMLTNCKCLLPSESNNPSQMLLYEGTTKEIVYIDENIFERDGIYLLKQ
ncbi:hypothetical protein [Desulfoluna spongiiphila]|uniref:hypothetical protein n=1 Tax=Desulfoluna spongiiphila TaxID=419481 RepID=UPI00125EE554|nr:hypothetical protein [Desulfoluna spongiiphila]